MILAATKVAMHQSRCRTCAFMACNQLEAGS